MNSLPHKYFRHCVNEKQKILALKSNSKTCDSDHKHPLKDVLKDNQINQEEECMKKYFNGYYYHRILLMWQNVRKKDRIRCQQSRGDVMFQGEIDCFEVHAKPCSKKKPSVLAIT